MLFRNPASISATASSSGPFGGRDHIAESPSAVRRSRVDRVCQGARARSSHKVPVEFVDAHLGDNQLKNIAHPVKRSWCAGLITLQCPPLRTGGQRRARGAGRQWRGRRSSLRWRSASARFSCGPGSPGEHASRHPARRPIHRAVLPFANLSGDPSQDYFSDGITRDIIASLWLCFRSRRSLQQRNGQI